MRELAEAPNVLMREEETRAVLERMEAAVSGAWLSLAPSLSLAISTAWLHYHHNRYTEARGLAEGVLRDLGLHVSPRAVLCQGLLPSGEKCGRPLSNDNRSGLCFRCNPDCDYGRRRAS